LSLPTATQANKGNPEEFLAEVKKYVDDYMALETSPVLDSPELDSEPRRMVARAARIEGRRRGANVVALEYRSGLSSAAVAKAEFVFADGSVTSSYIKVQPNPATRAEFDRYRSFVSNRLAVGTFAPTADPWNLGLGKYGALVMTVVDPNSRTLFELCDISPDDGVAAIMTHRENIAPWTATISEAATAIGELRRSWISDEELAVRGVDVSEFLAAEETIVPMRYAIGHGDLHGANLLVRRNAEPVMIDFAATGTHPVALDPVSLSLSFAFHPQRTAEEWAPADTSWPLDPRGGTPAEYSLRWALETDAPQAVAGLCYAVSMWQVKHQPTPELPLRLARLAAGALRRTNDT
jgi:hypothetical protein